MLVEIGGNLVTDERSQYIAHQCNCITTEAAGLARSIFLYFPHSNVYRRRTERSLPGTIEVCGGDGKERGVINLFAQYYPGKANYEVDSYEKRIEWMKKCLAKIYNMRDSIDSIAFPHGMGCDLAGGDWDVYRGLIKKLADNMPNTTVYIIKQYSKDIEKSERKILGKPIEPFYQVNDVDGGSEEVAEQNGLYSTGYAVQSVGGI